MCGGMCGARWPYFDARVAKLAAACRGDDRCLYVGGTSVFDAICFASKSNVLYSLGNH